MFQKLIKFSKCGGSALNALRLKPVSQTTIKKHSRTNPDVQFKEFSLTKQKTRPRTDYERIGKTI